MNEQTLQHEPVYCFEPVAPFHRFSYHDTLAEDVLGADVVEHLQAAGMGEREICDYARQKLVQWEHGTAYRSPHEKLMPLYDTLTDMVAEEILLRLTAAVKDREYDDIRHWQKVFNTISEYL